MKQSKVLKIGIIVLSVLIIIGVIVLYNMFVYPKSLLANLEYDILIEEHRNQYAGMADIPATGYSTTYYYTVINSTKKEKYTLIYQDVWDIHNQNGDIDSIKIEIEEITDEEVQRAINEYGKKNKKSKLKDLFEQNIEEKYRIKSIERK